MVVLGAGDAGGGYGDRYRSKTAFDFDFGMYGINNFAPFYSPSRISISKERKLNRKEDFCGGETVDDIGEKNREIHISGLVLGKEIAAFNALLDDPVTYTLITNIWDGQVRVDDGDIEGPGPFDPIHKDRLFKYTLNLVSTGRDESGTDDGIIASGG